LDYYGYHLAERQGDLTVPQELFLLIGKPLFDKRMQERAEKESKRRK